jgi:hypothetical protein
LWHADPLLDSVCEIGDCTATVTKQRPANNRRMAFSERSAKQQMYSNRGTMLSVLSVPRCYKQDNWSNELAVGQSPASKHVSTEAEDIVGVRHQTTTVEDITD